MIRIISFNINGLRARPHQLEKLREVYDPDLIAIQEIKVSDEDFPPQIPESLGYKYFNYGQKGFHGVAIFSKTEPTNVIKGLNHFRLASLTLDIRKWISWKFVDFRLGAGSNFFKEVSYSGNHNAPAAMEGQINFIGVDAIIRYTIINIGAGTRIHPGSTMVTFFFLKELF